MTIAGQRSIWVRLSSELGFTIETPDEILFGSGIVRPIAVVKGFGAQSGVMVIERYEEVISLLREVEHAGYGFSVLELEENCNAEKFKNEVLADWGEVKQ